jgi:3-phenylpropionate/cinnamic acid dioxygenase small subunit
MSAVGTVVDLETRLAVEDFLYHEAELLDDRKYDAWLALFTEDVRYTAPIKVTRKAPAVDVVDDIGHFDDTIHSLGLRVRRLSTDVAWAEDPPSHTRRIVGNIRIRATDDPDELAVRNNLLLFRSRGDLGAHDLIAGERHDLLRRVDGAWRIARRRAVLDQSSLGTKNLGVFL